MRNAPRSQVVAVVSLAALLVVLVFYAILGYQTHAAVCALRQDVQQRQEQSRDFLKLTLAERKARYGPIGAVPDDALKASIENQQHTIDSLGGLWCSFP